MPIERSQIASNDNVSEERIQDKQQKKKEKNEARIQQQREIRKEALKKQHAQEVRKKTITITICVGLLLLLVGLVIVFRNTNSNSSANASYPPVDGISCDQLEQTQIHYHVHLTLYINGQTTPLPALLGIAPDQSCYYWLHTHDTSGIVHIESPSGDTFTLGEFFDEWVQRFNTLQYPSQLSSSAGWVTYVNGQLSSGDFHKIVLTSHQLITLAYNSPNIKPDTTYNWGNL